MPSLSTFADCDVITRRKRRQTDPEAVAAVRERVDRGCNWAVGAFVTDEANSVLLIYEDDCWKLPGGGVEAGESREVAVRREVREETGVEISLDGLAAVTEVTVAAGDRSSTFFFGTYRGTPRQTALADDPGTEGEAIDRVTWRRELPKNCMDRDLLRRLR